MFQVAEKHTNGRLHSNLGRIQKSSGAPRVKTTSIRPSTVLRKCLSGRTIATNHQTPGAREVTVTHEKQIISMLDYMEIENKQREEPLCTGRIM